MAPFLGVIGVPPAESGVHSTIPPRASAATSTAANSSSGARCTCRSRWTGALLSAGDAHAAQGDGEVGGTAIECPLDAGRADGGRTPRPRAADADGAHGDALDRVWVRRGSRCCRRLALQTMLDLMEREHGLGRSHALALASVAVDLHVTQIVNGTKGVHAILATQHSADPRHCPMPTGAVGVPRAGIEPACP